MSTNDQIGNTIHVSLIILDVKMVQFECNITAAKDWRFGRSRRDRKGTVQKRQDVKVELKIAVLMVYYKVTETV